MSFFFSFLSFFFKLRERGYIKLGIIRRNGPKIYLSFSFFFWSSCGEDFLFYRLIDFMLFLILAWRIGSFVSEISFSSSFTRSTWLWFCPHEPCPTTNFLLLSISADGKESPLPFWGPSQSFGFSLLPSRVRRPEWGHQVQTSVLNGHSLMACYC